MEVEKVRVSFSPEMIHIFDQERGERINEKSVLSKCAKEVLYNVCKHKGWIYLIVYFIMFPLGFQGAKLLDRWLNDINEQISGMHIYSCGRWCGILAALFLLAMLLLHRRLVVKYPACPWLSSAICAFHMILGVLISMFAPAQILLTIWIYVQYKVCDTTGYACYFSCCELDSWEKALHS